MKMNLCLIGVALIAAISDEGLARGADVDGAAIADESRTDVWLSYGRTYSESRFSPLDQVNDGNVGQLSVDWYLDLPDARMLCNTPLMVAGVLYFEAGYNVVHAVDATTGELLWQYDPKVIEVAGERLRIMWDVSRGLAFWKGKVYSATIDGRLIAIDAATGEEVWQTMTVDPELPFFITGAPRVFKDIVVIGNGGTELGPIRGYLGAYDADTGDELWRFYTVPGNPADGFEDETQEMAAETWTGEWWKYGGGGTVWHGITYDPELDLLYIGTGNGAPWNQRIRSPDGGDNLFLCSVVALDPDTGEYRWHYQTTPGETWDYNDNMDIVLADLEIGGRTVKALMHAPKNGFFYVIDRETGNLVSAEPFGHITWATHVDMETGRPVEVEGSRYEDHDEEVWPGPVGAHSWHAMSYNPETGLVYIPSIDLSGGYNDTEIDVNTWESPDFAFDAGVAPFVDDIAADAGTSALKAWDPVKQQLVWEVPNPGAWNAGTLTTAGNLIFQGHADGLLKAYRADTGEEVLSFAVGSGVSAPPITYSINGEQHIALLVGWGGAIAGIGGSLGAQHGWAYKAHMRRLISFSLSGTASLPKAAPREIAQPIQAPHFQIDRELAARGKVPYARVCAFCHGSGAVAAGFAPDLRASAVVPSDISFTDVVRGGSRRNVGMPSFSELSDEELKALQHYLRSQAVGESLP